MKFEIFQSAGKGRTAVNVDKVDVIVDNEAEGTDVKTTLILSDGKEVKLGTKFKTVLRKFVGEDAETETE